jgi:hypothetical protein
MNGHFNFHFDEAATLNFILSGYTVYAWNEL